MFLPFKVLTGRKNHYTQGKLVVVVVSAKVQFLLLLPITLAQQGKRVLGKTVAENASEDIICLLLLSPIFLIRKILTCVTRLANAQMRQMPIKEKEKVLNFRSRERESLFFVVGNRGSRQ